MLIRRYFKTRNEVKDYYSSTLNRELFVLRWLGVVGSILTFWMMYVDIARASNATLVLELRIVSLVWLVAGLIMSFLKHPSVSKVHTFIYLYTSAFYATAFLMDYYGGLPTFFLTNIICLYLFLFNSAFGHPLAFRVTQTLITVSMFIYYSASLSPHSSIHSAQTFNIIINAVLSVALGIIIERHSVTGYLRQLMLDRARESAEKTTEMKTRLISVLSHDLISPINNLSSLISLREGGHISQGDMNSHSEGVKHALENLSVMMRSLLSWSRLHLNDIKLKTTELDLPKLLNEVVESLQYAISAKQVKVINRIERHVPIMANVEIVQIAVRNFISNAIKFSKEGGTIHIYSKHDANTLTVRVKDEGIGMNREQQEILFSNKVTSRRGTHGERGSGIGLMITRDLIEMVGGTILVQSEVNRGSEFVIAFPVKTVSGI